MSESISLGELTLADKASQVANRIAASLDKVEKKSEKAKRSLDFEQSLKGVEERLAKLNKDPVGFQKLVKAQKELREHEKKLREGANREGFWQSFTSKLPYRSIAQYTQAAFMGDLMAEGVMKIGETLMEAAEKFVDVIKEGFVEAVKESAKLQELRTGFKLTLGKEGGKESMEDIERFSKLTAFGPNEIARLMLPMREAGFNQRDARTTLSMAADLAARKGKGSDLGTVQQMIDTLTQVKLHGGVRKTTLEGMGINAPVFYSALAKELKIGGKAGSKKTGEGATTAAEEAKKLATAGKIDPQILLNAIGRSIEKMQGGKLGTGALAAEGSMAARLHKLSLLPEQYFEKMVDSPAFAKLSDRIQETMERLNPDSPEGKRILDGLTKIFDKIVDLIEYITSPAGISQLTAAIEGFLRIVKMAIDVLGGFIHTASSTIAHTRVLVGTASDAEKETVKRELLGTRAREAGFQGGIYGPVTPKLLSVLAKETGVSEDVFTQAVQAFQKGAGAGEAYINKVSLTPAADKGGGKKIDIHVHPGAVVVQTAPGEDPDHTQQRAGEGVRKHITNAIERAAQEAGG